MSEDDKNATSIDDTVIDVEPKVIEEAKPARRRNWLWLLVPLALLLIGLGGGVWGYRNWLSTYLPSDQVTALAKRVDGLEATNKDTAKRVDAVVALTEELKTKIGAAQAAADKSAQQHTQTETALADVRQGLDKATADLADVQARLSSGAVAAGADPALASRVAALEANAAQPAPVAAAPAVPDLSANLAAVKTAIASGAAYAEPLAPLAKAHASAAGLDVLKSESAGLATAPQLAQELDGLRGTLPKGAPATADDTSGFWGGFKSMMSHVVRVKRVGGTDWATLAAKAQAFAASGDLQQAAGVFAATKDTPPALQGWLDKAARRAKLEQALEQFSAAVAKG